jgi:hypothetical protein
MKWYAGVGVAAAALVLAACMDSPNPVGPTGQVRPKGPSFSVGTPISGAIFTTDVACTGTDLNIYSNKSDVYIDGGPAHPGAAGLPDGEYYVQVTSPSGTLLGTSIGAADETPVTVSGGEFAVCYQLSAILIKASDATPGYDDTPNPGGEYKVWVSLVNNFEESQTKTDNFKVKTPDGCNPEEGPCGPPPSGTLSVLKWYDVNANGIHDENSSYDIIGWKVNIKDGIDLDRFTPVALVVAPDDYVVSEYDPIESNWIHTTPTSVGPVTVTAGGSPTVEFGNVCVGAGGGLTIGFWSNRNGQALLGAGDLALLVSLNLRNANGTDFDPATNTAFKNWLLSANATNMAYMLSAQLAAMEMNVFNGFVNGNALIYAPGAVGANSLGFISVNDLMAEANTELGVHGLTVAASPERTYQEALKNALDKGNNNLNFVQSSPCPFSF